MTIVHMLKFTVQGAASLWEIYANPGRLPKPLLHGPCNCVNWESFKTNKTPTTLRRCSFSHYLPSTTIITSSPTHIKQVREKYPADTQQKSLTQVFFSSHPNIASCREVLFDISTGYFNFSFFSLNTQRIQVKHNQLGYRACQATALIQDALIKTNTFCVLRVT